MPVIPPYKYTDIRSSLKTGDLFLFYGQSDAGMLIEDLEALAGMPPFSHVGMVINDGGNLYFWDAPGGGARSPIRTGTTPTTESTVRPRRRAAVVSPTSTTSSRTTQRW